MIACLCRGVSERAVRALVAGGARSVTEIRRACGAGGDCGSCRATIAALVSESTAGSYLDAVESGRAQGGGSR